MGSGIAIAFAQAGIPVVVVDNNDEAVDKARQTVMGMFMYQVQKGRLTQEEAWKRGQSIAFTDDWSAPRRRRPRRRGRLRGSRRQARRLRKLDAHRQTGSDPRDEHLDARRRRDGGRDPAPRARRRTALLRAGEHHAAARNRARREDVAADDRDGVCSSARHCARRRVLSANAFGFIGNRMIFDYVREAIALAEEGVAPARVDAVMKAFGFPMGPFAMCDLSGLDVGLAHAEARGAEASGARTCSSGSSR